MNVVERIEMAKGRFEEIVREQLDRVKKMKDGVELYADVKLSLKKKYWMPLELQLELLLSME